MMAAKMREYLAEASKLQTTNPLTYWVMKEMVWPDFSATAKRLVSCPLMSM